MRGSPSTVVVSFASARTLSLERALARLASNRFRSFPDPCSATSAAISSTSMREYQRSRFDIPANSLIASR